MHLYKLLVAMVATCALAGAMASGASAAVEVANTGPIAVNGSLGLGVYDGQGGITNPAFHCTLAATAESTSEGAVTLSDIDFDYGGMYDNCTMSACEPGIWEGQILGPDDEGYLGVADFELLVPICTTHTGTGPLRISIDQEAEDELLSLPVQQIPGTLLAWFSEPWYGGWYTDGSASFGISSVEE